MKEPKEDLRNHSNIEDITTTRNHLLHMIQIHDSAFPIGGYTHSFGMETLIQSQVVQSAEDLFQFCSTYITHNVACGDGIFVKEAYKWRSCGDWSKLQQLEDLCHASKLAAESKEASKRMGRQFLKTVIPLSESEKLEQYKKKLDMNEVHGHYAISYGLYVAENEFPLSAAILTFLYSSVSNLVQNAVRAIPLGQSAGVQTMHRLLPIIEEATAEVEVKSVEDISNQAIEIELSSMQHEFLFSRLFIS